MLLLRPGVAQQIKEEDFILYTKSQGLSHNYISSIVQDSLGSLWIGTHKGLSRFDGQFFQTFFKQTKKCALPNNMITALRVVNGKEIVGATLGGAFSISTGSFICKPMIVPGDSLIYFWSNQVQDADKDAAGNYLISTKTGLFVFDSGKNLVTQHQQFGPDDVGKKELFFGQWLHTTREGVTLQRNRDGFLFFDPATNRIVTQQEQGLRSGQNTPDDIPYYYAQFMNRDDDFFVFGDNTVDVYQAGHHEPIRSTLPAYGKDILNVYRYSDSSLALTFTSGGFAILNYDRATGKCYGEPAVFFKTKYCTYIFKDREGRLWIGTRDGLYKQHLANAFFTSTDLSGMIPGSSSHSIRAILGKGNVLYAGLDQSGGLLALDKTTKKLLRKISFEEEGEGCNTILYLFDFRQDTIWIGTDNGLLWMNTTNNAYGRITAPPSLDWINTYDLHCIRKDSRGHVWISSRAVNSVAYYIPEQKRFVAITPEANPLLRTTKCWSMEEDREGNMWLAGDGLCRWNRQKEVVDKLIPYPTVTSSLRNYMLILDADQDDNLWLSSFDNEIIQYNCSRGEMYLRMRESSLIEGNSVTSSPIIDGNIWLGTDNGISVFNIHDYSIKQFTYADGLPTVVITTFGKRSYYDRAGDQFYIGAGHHLVSFTPDVALAGRAIPKLVLQQFTTADTTLTDLTKPLSLPYFQNDIALTLSAINYNDPEDNRIAYCLISDGDSSWTDVTLQNNIYLNNLSPGSYQLEVKLFSANNRWTEQTQRVAFVIFPPFWRTWYFFLSLSVVTGVVLYAIYRGHIRRIRRRASIDQQVTELEMKALHAQMNPHFIFNSLNSIKDMILQNENTDASRYLSKFAHLVRLNLEYSQQNFISLHQQVEYLKYYLTMEQIRFANFTYEIHTDKNLNVGSIRIIPMLIQPLVENALWHGLLPKKTKKKVDIRFRENNDQLICEIEDNGIGINQSVRNKSMSVTHRSLGIKNIQQRLAVLNDKYNMNSSLVITDKSDIDGQSEGGTLAVLTLPVEVELFEDNHKQYL